MRDLPGLLETLDPGGSIVERHLWLADLLRWIRGDGTSADASLARLRLLLDALQARPDKQEQLRHWWRALNETLDVAVLLADFGFSSRNAFVSEFAERLRLKLLPATPETRDATELFALVMSQRSDARWLQAMDDGLGMRLAALLGDGPGTQVQPDHQPSRWQATLLEAITICTSQVRAAGFASELRLRMSEQARAAAPFHSLAADFERLRASFLAARAAPGDNAQDLSDPAFQAALLQFRTQLEACRAAGASVYAHLDEHGVSVSLVFRIRQLRERILRIRALLDCLGAAHPTLATTRLLAHLVQVGQDRRSLRSLMASNSSMLAAKVTERSSEVGEHYITRSRHDMLRKAAGGGALTALTTWMKFSVMALGLSAFWSGFWSSLVYAGSFVLIQLLHCTLATKQPAMTAPAMAAKLKDLDEPGALEQFVDEVTHLVRSQVAAVLGNVGVVFPVVVAMCLLIGLATGHSMLDSQRAEYVLHSLTLLGPTALFAAFTGVLLFAASIIAGWTENWFVFNRLDSALRYNPVFTRRLGAQRCERWATFLRNNVSGLASNIALGLMLGLVPAFAGFFGLGLDARHVTLSTGQLAAASAALGWDVLRSAAFWWCVAAIPVIGALNLGVSFYCAFRLALLSHNVGALDRRRITSAIWSRLRRRPLEFVWPTAQLPIAAAPGKGRHG